jgi:hypothetical protein
MLNLKMKVGHRAMTAATALARDVEPARHTYGASPLRWLAVLNSFVQFAAFVAEVDARAHHS